MADPDDATVQIEVSVGRPRRPLEAAVIYLTKVNGREVGRQSVGMPPRVARDIAAMLQTAADEFK